jgi:hypothetical protein
MSASAHNCIYCLGPATKINKGEHIIPDVLGGDLTILDFCNLRVVCNQCNNGVLSVLDRELCSRSPLAWAAAHVIDGFVWQSWDVDDAADSLLLEARPDFANSSMHQYPQIVFEEEGPQLRGDLEEIEAIGADSFQDRFLDCLLDAFSQFLAGKRSRLNHELMQLDPAFLNRYRYPPRVFSRRPIRELKRTSSLIFRYMSSDDKEFALNQIRNWDRAKPFRDFSQGLGSEFPAFRSYYEQGTVLRALIKIGFNLISAFCPNTPIEGEAFRNVANVITGKTPFNHSLCALNGFVEARHLACFSDTSGGHAFVLQHINGWWHVHSSFFGGMVGTYVRFPAPNSEEWSCASIVAPIRSKEWKVSNSNLTMPITANIEWKDLNKIIPGIDWLNVHSATKVREKKISASSS